MCEIEKLFWQIFNSKNETELHEIIQSNQLLNDDNNWRHYGLLNNIGTVTGQSPEPVPSLIEKITNSIDAILIKECINYGDKPDSDEAPKSMEEGLKKYFNLTEERYIELSDNERRKFASRIQVIAEGSKTNPNILIYDDGEGQKPQDFPNTFLSIGKGNKESIFFVQGKYNMGGTAVLPFCGENKYQLILSKKSDQKINNNFGFTLVRRNRGIEKKVKSSWYEYCVDKKGNIFEFESDPIDIGLYDRKFSSGTVIKLYNYDLINPSYITLDLWYALNRWLYKSALPILLYETRYEKGHSMTKMMHGNRMRCRIDDRDKILNFFSGKIKSDKIFYPIEVLIFKQDVDTDKFIKNMALIFTVNGQVQHPLDNRFISQQLKKAYLKNHILINIDCSNMPRVLNEDIFMSDRAHMRNKKEYRNLLESIIKELKDNEYLTNLDQEWMKDQIIKNPKDEIFLKNIVGKLLKDDNEILKLLGLNGGIISKEITKIKKDIEDKNKVFKGKSFPTFFKFKNIKPGKYKMLPQNGECKIAIQTDVENEYLIRPHDKGELKIKIKKPYTGTTNKKIEIGEENEEVLDVNSVGPNEGDINLRVKSNTTIPIGSVIPVDIELTSPNGPFILSVEIKINNPNIKGKEKDISKKKEYSLPQLIEVFRENIENNKLKKCWADYSWNELDICQIIESSQENCLVDAIAINMESKELENYVRLKKITGKKIEFIQRSYKSSVYLISLVLFYELRQKLNKQEEKEVLFDDKDIYDPKDLVSYMMKGMAKILLHLMTNEYLLKEFEATD